MTMIGSDNVSTLKQQNIIEKIEANDFEWLYNHFSDYFQDVTSLVELKSILKEYNKISTTHTLFRHIKVNKTDEFIWIADNRQAGVSVTLNKYYEIVSMVLLPLEKNKSQKLTKQYYTMPIEGEYFVSAGGDNELLNHHFNFKYQRNAYDLTMVNEDMTYQGTPNQNENYYCYGQSVLAPANGKVVQTLKNIKDNTPGEANTNHPEGNFVIIQHQLNEYSIVAHLQSDSIKVDVGDIVRRGQHIANIGNSGNSSEPHLHFHIMNKIKTHSGYTYKIKFLDQNEPLRGDKVYYSGDKMKIESHHALTNVLKNYGLHLLHRFKN
ncbi:peptidase M23 [Staphylococcus arlettae]|nr:peptidase M23 [Staphylococcus arlettae]PTH53657.1 peptidase M23 [Staphylococcus arlettae]